MKEVVVKAICSFCGREANDPQVDVMIASGMENDEIYICSVCVENASSIIELERAGKVRVLP